MDAIRKLLGPFPAKTELAPTLLEKEDCGSFTREKVEYAVEAGERVSAYLCIPKNITSSTAAIFCHHQHAGNFVLGKSEVVGLAGDPDQAYARELAERGFITFAPDAIAFEERNWSDSPGKAEYFELATRLVQGKTLITKVLHDVSVGLDYLTSRKEVARNRLGFIGHSYGGRMALWVPAFDKRITASVSNCGCVPYRYSLTHDAGIQMEFCIPGIMKKHDLEDIIEHLDDTSLLISATTDDKWSRGAEELYENLKKLNKNDIRLKMYEGQHVFSQEMREYAYSFLEEKLGV